MKRPNIIALIVCAGLFLNINTSRAQSTEKLAQKILNDPKLDTVLDKAKQLLSKGFNAGDGYPQVWIRDLNTFIEISSQRIRQILKDQPAPWERRLRCYKPGQKRNKELH